jgi:hypothetical protein
MELPFRISFEEDISLSENPPPATRPIRLIHKKGLLVALNMLLASL